MIKGYCKSRDQVWGEHEKWYLSTDTNQEHYTTLATILCHIILNILCEVPIKFSSSGVGTTSSCSIWNCSCLQAPWWPRVALNEGRCLDIRVLFHNGKHPSFQCWPKFGPQFLVWCVVDVAVEPSCLVNASHRCTGHTKLQCSAKYVAVVAFLLNVGSPCTLCSAEERKMSVSFPALRFV